MAINYSSFVFLLLSSVLHLFLFSCSKKVEATKFEESTANLRFQNHVVSLSSFTAEDVCSTSTQGSQTSSGLLQVANKYGPCSPLKEGIAKVPNFLQILTHDQTRVKTIHSKISNKDPLSESAAKIRATSGQSLGNGNFVVTIGIGTPKQNYVVIFDTGSDLTWIQCQPCVVQCYSQQDPIFNPSASVTYSNISCNSVACSQLQSATGNTQSCGNTCIYLIQYGDGSYTKGYFGTDTLSLSTDVFPKFPFGCGQNNNGLFGSADGLLGLGRDKLSLVSQTSQKYGKLFSYCLPSSTSTTGFLAFGSQVGASSISKYTSLLTDPKTPSFYFLSMTGISVGGKSLAIAASVFTTAKTIIDSGTTITQLAPAAYSALRSAFRQAMMKYPSAPPGNSLLDTCYDLSKYTTVSIPTIVLHFSGGTDLNVDPSGILFQVSSTTYCLAFAGNKSPTYVQILGNSQQQTYEVVYDLPGGKLGFGAGACS